VATDYTLFRIALSLSALFAVALLMTGSAAFGQESTPFTLTSTAFTDGSRIPDRYTCNGKNVSPPLAWSGVPGGTASLALIMDDPDAPGKTWVHWVLYNIDPKTAGLPESVSIDAIGAVSGITSFSRPGYGGPCPPIGRGVHRYIFTLYALSARPAVAGGATKAELLSAIDGITIATAKLTGLYSR